MPAKLTPQWPVRFCPTDHKKWSELSIDILFELCYNSNRRISRGETK